MTVNDLPLHSYVAMVFGYLFMASLLLAVLFVIVDRVAEGWLRGKRNAEALCDGEIPEFVQGDNWNRPNQHTATLSFAEFKAAKTNHPSTGASERRESRIPRRSDGGEKEGA